MSGLEAYYPNLAAEQGGKINMTSPSGGGGGGGSGLGGDSSGGAKGSFGQEWLKKKSIRMPRWANWGGGMKLNQQQAPQYTVPQGDGQLADMGGIQAALQEAQKQSLAGDAYELDKLASQYANQVIEALTRRPTVGFDVVEPVRGLEKLALPAGIGTGQTFKPVRNLDSAGSRESGAELTKAAETDKRAFIGGPIGAGLGSLWGAASGEGEDKAKALARGVGTGAIIGAGTSGGVLGGGALGGLLASRLGGSVPFWSGAGAVGGAGIGGLLSWLLARNLIGPVGTKDYVKAKKRKTEEEVTKDMRFGKEILASDMSIARLGELAATNS